MNFNEESVMSGFVNKAILVGNLGGDPEIRTIPSGEKVANVSLATNESWTNKEGEKVERTEWHRLVVWRKLAEVMETYCKKGDKVYIEGKITTRSWEDQNQVKRYTTEIVVNALQMLGSKRSSDGSGQSAGAPPPPAEDDLPF